MPAKKLKSFLEWGWAKVCTIWGFIKTYSVHITLILVLGTSTYIFDEGVTLYKTVTWILDNFVTLFESPYYPYEDLRDPELYTEEFERYQKKLDTLSTKNKYWGLLALGVFVIGAFWSSRF